MKTLYKLQIVYYFLCVLSGVSKTAGAVRAIATSAMILTAYVDWVMNTEQYFLDLECNVFITTLHWL